MVDASLVLDAIVAVSIAAGAFFAVLELRTMSKDRKTGLIMRAFEFGGSLEFEQAIYKFVKARFHTRAEAEEQISAPELMMIADYCEGIGTLAQRGLVPTDVVLDILPFEYAWDKLKVWARTPSDSDDPTREKYGPTYPAFEWLANEARKMRLAGDRKAKYT